jgi:hypothetical protein
MDAAGLQAAGRTLGPVPRCQPTRLHPGHKYHLPRQSAWFGVFMFGTAAVAHTTQLVAGKFMQCRVPPGRAAACYLLVVPAWWEGARSLAIRAALRCAVLWTPC